MSSAAVVIGPLRFKAFLCNGQGADGQAILYVDRACYNGIHCNS